MNLKMSSLYEDLDRGDGVCRYFDLDTKLCSVYENRPQKCNVDMIYELYYSKILSREQYYDLNYKACERLKREGK